MRDGNWMKMEVPSKSTNLQLVKYAVAAFAAGLPFTLQEIEDLKVAVSEAVTNCIVHAYPGGEGLIAVYCRQGEDKLSVEVRDDGVGIEDIPWARQASNTTDDERMGLGMFFMEQMMDELTIESEPGRGTAVIMTKTPERAKSGC